MNINIAQTNTRYSFMFNPNRLKEKLVEFRDSTEKAASEAFLSRKVSAEIQKTRFDICKSCEHLYTPTNTCKKCGCFMGVKTWIEDVKCPVNKWGTAIPEEKKNLIKRKNQ